MLTLLELLSIITLSDSALPLPFSDTKYPALEAMSVEERAERDKEDVIPGPMVKDAVDEVAIASPGRTIVAILLRVLLGLTRTLRCTDEMDVFVRYE